MRLVYEISATGTNQLKRVFRSVEQEAMTANRRAVDRSTRQWARSLAQIKRELARTEAAGGRVAARAGGTGAAAGAVARPGQSRQHVAKMANISREERAQLRAIARAESVTQRGESVRHRIRLRNIEREKAMEISAAAAARVKSQARWTATTARLGAGAARSIGGAVGSTGRFLGGALALGGGFAAMGAIRNQMDVERASSVLAAKALGTPGETRTREQIRASVMGQSRELGATSGLGAEGVISALSSFTAISGRLGMGQKMASFMTDVADASGAAIEDVGRTAGQVVQAMMARGMAEPEAIAQTKEIISSMMAQAKVGSIEFADLATQMGKVMSSTAAFDGKVSDLATTMGAISQLAIAGAASSPEEAMTAILRFRDDLIQNAKRFQAQGVNVFADKGKTRLRAPEQILVEMLTKTKGSLPAVSKLFGIRSAKAVTPFQALYTEKGGGEAGVQAVNELLKTTMATMPEGEIEASAAFRRRDADKRMAMNVERFNAAIGERLLPVVTDLVPTISDLIPVVTRATEGVATFAKWAVKNPYEGIGAIIAAKVGADLLSAGIGKAVSAAFSSILANQKLTVASMSIGAVLGGIMLAKATMTVIKATTEQRAGEERGRGETVLEEAQREMATTGHLSPETKARVQKLQTTREKQFEAGKAEIARSSTLTGQISAGAQTVASWFGFGEGLQRRSDVMAGASDVGLAEQRNEASKILTAQSIWEKTGASFAEGVDKWDKTAADLSTAASDISNAVKGIGGTAPVASKRQSPVLNRGG